MNEEGYWTSSAPLEPLVSWAEVALRSARREFPHAELLEHRDEGSATSSFRSRHPSFYGAYDWHSSVEMHWVMVRLLGFDLPSSLAARLVDHLSVALAAENLALEGRELPFYECPYGYAWLLRLADEVESCTLPVARQWSSDLEPLARAVAARLVSWAASDLPVRGGLHSNSAFSSVLALPYARARAPELAGAIAAAARRWYGRDVGYPFSYEPSAHDFLSPGLSEAVLMSEVLEPEDFLDWFDGFSPGGEEPLGPESLRPVVLGATDDGQVGHLHGLNLSRAFCLRRLAASLPQAERRHRFGQLAEEHASCSMPFVTGTSFMLEHWLAAYAVLYAT